MLCINWMNNVRILYGKELNNFGDTRCTTNFIINAWKKYAHNNLLGSIWKLEHMHYWWCTLMCESLRSTWLSTDVCGVTDISNNPTLVILVSVHHDVAHHTSVPTPATKKNFSIARNGAKQLTSRLGSEIQLYNSGTRTTANLVYYLFSLCSNDVFQLLC